MSKFTFTYCSDEDYDDLIAEVYYSGEFVAVISQESGYEKLDIKIYPRENSKPWLFKLEEFLSATNEAKIRLWDLRKQN